MNLALNRKSSYTLRKNRRFSLETLETRQLMSATPLTPSIDKVPAVVAYSLPASPATHSTAAPQAAQPSGGVRATSVDTLMSGSIPLGTSTGATAKLAAVKALAGIVSTYIVSVVNIQNHTSNTINFSIKWPGGNWQSCSLAAGGSQLFWCTGAKQSATIAYDWSFAAGYQQQTYNLSSLDFMAGGINNLKPHYNSDGAQFSFNFNASRSGLSFFAITPLDKTKNLAWRAAVEGLSDFPNLMSNFEAIGAPTKTYNCIAHSLGIHDRWVWPGDTVADFDKLDGQYGYKRTSTLDYSVVAGYTKIVLYGITQNGRLVCTHQAKQEADGTWTSKLGANALIRHLTPDALDGPIYGRPIAVYIKKI